VILFFISFLLVFVSSYFITSVIAPKRSIVGFLYLFIIAFAQIVLTFEVLSLFSVIKPFWVLGLNSLIFIGSIFLWQKNSKPLWSLDCKDFKTRVINSFKLDRSLIFLFVGFLALLLSAMFLCLIMPITSLDGFAYHVARSLFWVFNGTLNHFETADVRALCMPINSEILYAWVLLFTKKAVFLGFFSFVGYLLSIVSIYNILGFLGYCTRKKLWVIFILSSFCSVIVQVSSTETDIILAGLVSSCLFLFWYALKNNTKMPIFMASLAFALAVGTKTTALIAAPGAVLFLLALTVYYKKKQFYKPLLWFVGFGLINFFVFASYNYILNFIEFSSFMGAESLMQATKNHYGISGISANFIKYIFMFFDFSGFSWSDYVGLNITHLRDSILHLLQLSNIPDGLYSVNPRADLKSTELMMGAGVLGLLVYLPCLIWSIMKPIFRQKYRKPLFLLGFGLLFVMNLLVISYLVSYMVFNVRFIMFFIVLSSPVIVYSYSNKSRLLKYVIVAFAMFYLIIFSTHLWVRPFCHSVKLLISGGSITKLREAAEYKNYKNYSDTLNPTYALKKKIQNNLTKDNKILAFMNTFDSIYVLKSLAFDGYHVDMARLENIKNIDLDKYNVIISTNLGQASTVIKDYEKRKNECRLSPQKTLIVAQNNPVPCFYGSNPLAPKPENGKPNPPYQVQCIMTNDFIAEHHLLLIGTAGEYYMSNNALKYYTIFYNTNLPLFMKKRR